MMLILLKLPQNEFLHQNIYASDGGTHKYEKTAAN